MVRGDHGAVARGEPGNETFARRKERALYRLAARQNRVVTSSQLQAIGFSYAAIHRWVAMGRLFRLHHGVYLVGWPPVGRESRFHAAVLAVGDRAALTGFAAAALGGFWAGRTSPIEVAVTRRVRPRAGVAAIRFKELRPTELHGIPVTTVEQTILYLAGTMYSERHFRRLVHEALVQNKTGLGALLAEVARTTGRDEAVQRVVRELADGAKPTRSYVEDDLVELLRRGTFPPFDTNAAVPGTPSWLEVDVWFPQQRLAVEIDGPHHDTTFRREFDAYKDGVIRAADAGVLRLDDDAVSPARASETSARILLQLGGALA
jgi:very-short-patch-repair endonuclease